MTPRVLVRPEVAEDLQSIALYLAQFSVSVSDRFVDATFSTLAGLAEMPGKGSPKYYRGHGLRGIRSWSIAGFRNFLILYRPINDGIDVLAITHGAREIRTLLLSRI